MPLWKSQEILHIEDIEDSSVHIFIYFVLKS